MEQWEIDLREKLMRELPNGFYQFPTTKNNVLTGGTGKLGWIEFEVAMQKYVRADNVIIKDEKEL